MVGLLHAERYQLGEINCSRSRFPDAMKRGLVANVERMVRVGDRETIGKAVRNDPHGARYARIPNGPTCGFCIMLASRGTIEDMLTEKHYRETYVDTFIPQFEDDEPVSFDKWAMRQIAAEKWIRATVNGCSTEPNRSGHKGMGPIRLQRKSEWLNGWNAADSENNSGKPQNNRERGSRRGETRNSHWYDRWHHD
ncbi:hypothetical protein JS530_06620 [Bifidobacterium sp. LC6]|uniref:Uncharacterized protein n=1 Tax=Bifidobacterium colobi TaxID=2809026 RepID=A0ABS5UX13_9BIFI|nr:hypothetical protein [Bifidobacterium colobi]MBT1175171.1 hypothetical protein [Bifidobacterium colobi]